jgi:hypothetical protein
VALRVGAPLLICMELRKACWNPSRPLPVRHHVTDQRGGTFWAHGPSLRMGGTMLRTALKSSGAMRASPLT